MDEQEVLVLLAILIQSSEEAGSNRTLLKGINVDTFQWVLNEAAKIIHRTTL